MENPSDDHEVIPNQQENNHELRDDKEQHPLKESQSKMRQHA